MKKYRIIKVTHGDRDVWYEVQKKTWYGKWVNALVECGPGWIFDFPQRFDTFLDAERAYYCHFVSPVEEVVKEYE